MAGGYQTHELKSWPEIFRDVVAGDKHFEVRRDDRGFAVGDVIVLREWSPRSKTYTGREAVREITYISTWGQPEGQIVFGFGATAKKPRK